jgi:hypothetical protein
MEGGRVMQIRKRPIQTWTSFYIVAPHVLIYHQVVRKFELEREVTVSCLGIVDAVRQALMDNRKYGCAARIYTLAGEWEPAYDGLETA